MVAAAVAETLKNLSSNTGAEPSTSRIPMASAADSNAIQKEKDIKELKVTEFKASKLKRIS